VTDYLIDANFLPAGQGACCEAGTNMVSEGARAWGHGGRSHADPSCCAQRPASSTPTIA